MAENIVAWVNVRIQTQHGDSTKTVASEAKTEPSQGGEQDALHKDWSLQCKHGRTSIYEDSPRSPKDR